MRQYASLEDDKPSIKSEATLKRKEFKESTLKAVINVLKSHKSISRKMLIKKSGVSMSSVDDITRNLFVLGKIDKIIVPVKQSRRTDYKWIK